MANGKSGSFELAGTNGITVQVAWSETYDVSNNTSVISIDSLKAKSSLYENVEYFPNGSISVDGSAVVSFKSSSGTHNVYIDNLNRYYDVDGSPASPWKSAAITHNADGSKTAVIAVEIFFATLSGSNGHGAKISATKSVELTSIPRASSITSASKTTLGSTCSVKWSPLASSFRYRVTLSLGSWSLDSGILYPGNTSEYTYRVTIPLDVANQIPNNTSGTATAKLFTYSDSKGNTQVGSANSKTFTVTVPKNSSTQPSPGMTLKAVSTLPSKFDGLYVQGKTKVDANFSGSGKYNATVKSYKMSVDGKTFGSPYTSDYISKTGNVEVTGTATDSRGYTGTQTETIYVIKYAEPKIQVSICSRCDSSGNVSDSGTHLRIKATRSYSKVVDKNGASHNTCKVQYRYSQTGGSYGSWVTILANTSSSDTVDTGVISSVTLAVDQSYLVQVRTLDDIGGDATTTVSLPTEKVFTHRNGPINSWGFGGYENEPNTVSIAEDMTFHVKGTATGITAAMVGAAPSGFGLGEAPHNSSDINAELATGYFRTTSATDNSPFNHGAAHVRKYNDSEVVQNLFRVTAGVEMVRYTTDGGATWVEEWVNPLMNVGTEYLTTERYNGKPVYAKLVNFGALPNATNKNVAHAKDVDQTVIYLQGVLSNGVPFSTGYNHSRTSPSVKFWVDSTTWSIRILTEGDMTAVTATVLVKYIKGTTV